MPYTTPTEVKKRAAMKWSALNLDTGVPFATENAFDSWLSETVIPEAEKIINEFCLRPDFALHEDQEQLVSGDSYRHILQLSNQPVIDVSKIELQKNDSTWSTMSNDDYYARPSYVVLRIIPPAGFQNIRVTYDWGYSSVPEDVSHCAAEIAGRFLQKRSVYKMGPLVRVSDYRVELANPDIFSNDLKSILQHYRQDTTSIR